MAELTIQDIIKGMKNGAEAIDGNDKALATALVKFMDYDAIKGQVGWSGSNVMGANQMVTFTIPLSQCPNGWRVQFVMASGKTDRNEYLIPRDYPTREGAAAICVPPDQNHR